MKRFAQYIRVSTGPQALRFGPAVQEEANREYVARCGGELVGTYQDVDSGAKPTREAFDRLMRDGKAGLFDAVVAYKVGRVGRLAFISLQFAEELRKAGLEVHGAKTGAYNLKKAADRFRYQIDSVFAEFEYENLIQNMYDAKVKKASDGGLPQNWEPFGRRARYEPDGTRIVEVCEPEAAAVRRAFELADTGAGVDRIRQYLDSTGLPPRRSSHWTITGVEYLLHNRSYIGELVWRFGRTEGDPVEVRLAVEPIVPPDLFERVQVALAGRKRGGPKNSRADTPLVGLLRCGGCGWRLNLQNYDVRRGYFRCVNRRCPEEGYHLTYRKAQEIVTDLLKLAQVNPVAVAMPTPASGDDHTAQLASLRKRRERVLEMVELGLYSPAEGVARASHLDAEMAGLKRSKPVAASGDRTWHKRLAKAMKGLTSDAAMRAAGVSLYTWRDKRAELRFM